MRSALARGFAGPRELADALEAHISAYPYRVEPAGQGLLFHLPGRAPAPWHRPLAKRRFLKRRGLAYEPVATALFDFVLERMAGDTVFDLGAEIGYFSHLAAARRDLGLTVHAFEMRPDHHARLVARSAELGLSVEAHLAGMSDADRGIRQIWYSVTKMFETEPPPAAYRDHLLRRLKFRLQGRPGRDRLERAEVRIDSIDAFVARTGAVPGLIKIDIDGSEATALPGGRETFRRHAPVLLLELHRKRFLAPRGASRAGIVGFLTDLGYTALLMTAPDDLTGNRVRPTGPDDPRLARDRTDLLLFA